MLGDPGPRRRGRARAPAGAAQSGGALHGRGVGLPGGAVHEGETEAETAVREAQEEARLDLDVDTLVPFSRWITPRQVKVRFDTHFFVAPTPDDAEPQCDGEECVDLRWIGPAGDRGGAARRAHARLPHHQAPRAARRVRLGRAAARARAAGARSSRSSRACSLTAGSPRCCCPASRATTTPSLPRGCHSASSSGSLLALATAFTSIVGFLYKHRGAVESPPVEARRPVRTSLALFRSRWYTIGIIVATASWGLHVAALSLAPISLVQSVIAGGLVLLTVIADRLFGHDVTRREWIGVALTAAGWPSSPRRSTAARKRPQRLRGRHPRRLRRPRGRRGLGAALMGRNGFRHGIPLALSAGLLWGASGRLDQGAERPPRRGRGAGPPPRLTVRRLSLIGLAVSARSLQVGGRSP